MEKKSTKVLVVENHPLMREALGCAIDSDPNLKLAEPLSGGSGVFQLAISNQHDIFLLAEQPDIILFSLDNSDQEELQALKELRKKLLGTPILALVSGEQPGQEQAALEHGADLVVNKSVSRGTLLNALRQIQPKKVVIST